MRRFEFMFGALPARVSLDKADVEFHVIQDYGDHAYFGKDKPLDEPLMVYFARKVQNTICSMYVCIYWIDCLLYADADC